MTITNKNIKLHTPEWHEARSKTIGGSEVAALFGLSEYDTYYGLWHKKKGTISSDKDDGAMAFGRTWESSIMEMARVQGAVSDSVQKRDELIYHPTQQGMSCSLDYVDGDVIIEIKSSRYDKFKQWENGEPPYSYLLQAQHQLACTGAQKIRFIVWVIGEYEVRHFDYERDETIISAILDGVERFWGSIEHDIEPTPDFMTDGEYISEVFKNIKDERIEFDGDDAAEFNEAVKNYIYLSSKIKELESEKEVHKAMINYKLGHFKVCESLDFKASSPLAATERLPSKKELLKAAGNNQQLIDFINDNVKETTYRRLTVKKVGE